MVPQGVGDDGHGDNGIVIINHDGATRGWLQMGRVTMGSSSP